MSDESLLQYFDGCVKLYKDFIKQSSAEYMHSLGIVDSSSNDASENKSVTLDPEDHYYESNEWYALSKIDKDKVLKERIGRN